MCGIFGAIAERDITPILLMGLKRLEYRGYDSAGIAVLDAQANLNRHRAEGKVDTLYSTVEQAPISGQTGIAHTRWATHGRPAEHNAHPHMSGEDIALVHNGIIENHTALKKDLEAKGYTFHSDTDTEVIVHCIHDELKNGSDFLHAVQNTVKKLEGAFALGIISKKFPDRLIAVRHGSPLVIGLGIGENFIASDSLALLPVTQRFIYLEEGDIADLSRNAFTIYNRNNEVVQRDIKETDVAHDQATRGNYRHFMLKEIFEQPEALNETLEGRINETSALPAVFGFNADDVFKQVERIHIIACGTSYHASLVGRYWIETLTGIPVHVEIASEYRYRPLALEKNTLFVTLSQSGETADTLAGLSRAKEHDYLGYLAICNVPESSLVRASDFVFMTRAGAEIGVASTKAFITQLAGLLLFSQSLKQAKNMQGHDELMAELQHLPTIIQTLLTIDKETEKAAKLFHDKQSTLYLGRGLQFPIALEGALKLKELSYIHAEAYPAGELKHGPLALIDEDMLVIALAPKDELFPKIKSNLQEVRARGGQLIVLTDAPEELPLGEQDIAIKLPTVSPMLAPFVYTIPLQLLAYHVAVQRGTDVDQPRNLAKSVTVE